MPKLISPRVKSYVYSLAAQGYTAADIYALMEHDRALYGHSLPSLRTVQLLVKKYRQQDPTETWHITDCDNPEDAQIVLAHFRHAAEWASEHGLPLPKLSQRMADMLIRVHRAAPDIPLWLGWNVALGLLEGANPDYWHLLLATKPWQSEQANQHFYGLAASFWGAPVGSGEDDVLKRYPLGMTPFHLLNR